MARRKSAALVPNCSSLETRLSPSGNFLSHGYADVAREVNHLSHHRTAEHVTHKTDNVLGREMHHDHLNAHVSK